MTPLSIVTLFAFLPLGLAFFPMLPPARRALLFTIIGGTLFLPMAAVKLPGLIYTKAAAVALVSMFGILIFDVRTLSTFRFHWADLPMLVWCTVPFASSMSNGLGVYDGVWMVANRVIVWGIPYFVGRIYFCSAGGMFAFAVGIVIGGLCYVPLCLYEIQMSPQLHNLVYGFYQHDFAQTKRLGGWRPMVFMQHGLMVGMWMTSASLTALWLWVSGALDRMRRRPAGRYVIPLLITTVLCKSTGALALLGVGALVLMLVCRRPKAAPISIYLLLILAPLYVGLRSTGIWSGSGLVNIVESNVSADRSQSLAYRMENEDILAARALERPLVGWGGWDRARPTNEDGATLGVTDGLWIIALGDNGIVGVMSLMASLLVPTFLLARKYPVRLWRTPEYAAPAAVGMILVLWMLDNLMNAMINPVYIVGAGALTGFIARPVATKSGIPRQQGGSVRPRRRQRRADPTPVVPPSGTVTALRLNRATVGRHVEGTDTGSPPTGVH